VERGSPAEDAGIEPGDRVRITLNRDGREKEVTVRPAEVESDGQSTMVTALKKPE
jgi:hypothetical protein